MTLLFRRDALAGQSFANPKGIEQATRVVTAQLNRRAKPQFAEAGRAAFPRRADDTDTSGALRPMDTKKAWLLRAPPGSPVHEIGQ